MIDQQVDNADNDQVQVGVHLKAQMLACKALDNILQQGGRSLIKEFVDRGYLKSVTSMLAAPASEWTGMNISSLEKRMINLELLERHLLDLDTKGTIRVPRQLGSVQCALM